MNYNGIKCPVCEKPFTEKDDIVVCPVCGAPYHRTCYNEKGSCIFEELHEKGTAWMPPPPPTAPDVASEIKDKECASCGTLNAHSALFCNACGASLTGTPDQHRNTSYTEPPQDAASYDTRGRYPQPPAGGYGFGAIPFAFDPMGGTSPTEPLADNVTYGDASKLVQQNSGYYMSVFKHMNTFKRNKFNFSAFLFSGGWLLYRKQYKSGILITVLMFLLLIGNTLLSSLVTMPMVISICDAAGLNYAEITNTQMMDTLISYFGNNPSQYFLFALPLICYVGMFIIMLVLGFRGNRMYMKHCIRTVRSIKSTSHTESDSAMAYSAHGGVNPAAAVCLMICYFVVSWIPLFL